MSSDDRPSLLRATGIRKNYGAVRALVDADLTVSSGQIVALMGANGAGKSTLVKILTGALRHDGGDIFIRGQAHRFATPSQARKAGLVPIYQEPSLIPDLSLSDNLRLTDTPADKFRHWLGELGLDVPDFGQSCGRMPLASLRIIDLARGLASDPDILLLDEMTAALPTDLVDNVLRVVRQRADAGLGVIYISHRFTEIARLCDHTTILRDGKTVGELPVGEGIEDKVVELMLGAKIGLESRRGQGAETHIGAPHLRLRKLSAGAGLQDISFDLMKGEVLGIVALEGQGQDQLFDVLSGFRRSTAGTFELNGKAQHFHHPADAISAGVKLVPGDRADALLAQRSVRENIALPFSANLRNWGPLKRGFEKKRVDAAIEKLQIDTRAQGEVRRLSGGNQQKVTIARWIATGVDTLLLFDPTRGIDVRTKRQIYPLVRELAKQGTSVLYYTSEFAEIPLVCDRVAAIFNGRLVDIIDAGSADEEHLMRLSYGLKDEDKEAV